MNEIICFSKKDSPIIYLGCPLHIGRQKIIFYSPLVEQISKRISRWQTKMLIFGGRLTLIIFLIDALPTYMIVLFLIPPGVVNRLDSIRTKFLWQGNKESKGYHLVKWKK